MNHLKALLSKLDIKSAKRYLVIDDMTIMLEDITYNLSNIIEWADYVYTDGDDIRASSKGQKDSESSG
jgi:hypothetical protein